MAAGAGYLLGTSGGYGGPTFERHLQLGIVRRDRRAADGDRGVAPAADRGRRRARARRRSSLTLAALTSPVISAPR